MKRLTSLICTATLSILLDLQLAPAQSLERSKVQDRQLVAKYSHLPPQERVKLWLRAGGLRANFSFVGAEIENELIVHGLDTVLHLAGIVRRGKGYQRLGALKLLCQMDRFVPAEQLPEGVPGRELFGGSEPVGILDGLMIVDGRRIGKEGIETIQWAAEQTQHDDLRFHAREYSGLMNQDLGKLSLDEQLRQWRKSAAKCKAYPGMNDECKLNRILGDILKEKVDEALPSLIEMLEHDTDSYVREEAIALLGRIDRTTVRLRGTEAGRKAIEAIRKALLRCNQKPFLDDRASCDGHWKSISAQFFNDEQGVMTFNWMEILQTLYGLQLKHKFFRELSPEGQRFVTYLTKVDPYFPGWEFPHHSWEYAMHPRFKAKWHRYNEHWKRFKALEENTPGPSNGI